MTVARMLCVCFMLEFNTNIHTERTKPTHLLTGEGERHDRITGGQIGIQFSRYNATTFLLGS